MIIKSWQALLKGNKRELFRFFLLFIRSRILFFFILGVSIFHFTWLSIIVISAAFLLNQLLIEFFSQFNSYFKLFKIIHGFVFKYEHAQPTFLRADKYLISDYLGEKTYNYFNEVLNKNISLIGLTWELNDRINIYHIQIFGKTINSYKCYNVPPFKAYIFLQSNPYETSDALTKFFLLHEIAHSSLDSRSIDIFLQHCNKIYLTIFLITIFLFQWKTQYIVGGTCLLVPWLLANIDKRRALKKHRLADEISADEIAIYSLSKEDREELLNDYFIDYDFPDTSFRPDENEKRHKVRLNNLKSKEGIEENNSYLPNLTVPHYSTPTVLLILEILPFLFLITFSHKYGGLFTGILCFFLLIVGLGSAIILGKIKVQEEWINNRLINWQFIYANRGQSS